MKTGDDDGKRGVWSEFGECIGGQGWPIRGWGARQSGHGIDALSKLLEAAIRIRSVVNITLHNQRSEQDETRSTAYLSAIWDSDIDFS